MICPPAGTRLSVHNSSIREFTFPLQLSELKSIVSQPGLQPKIQDSGPLEQDIPDRSGFRQWGKQDHKLRCRVDLTGIVRHQGTLQTLKDQSLKIDKW